MTSTSLQISIGCGLRAALFILTSLVGLVCGIDVRADNYALLVGVRNYIPTELTNLKYTENDVVSLAELLRNRGYERRHIVLLTQTHGADNSDLLPTSGNIRKQLQLLLDGLDRSDNVLIAFSGHGVQFSGEAEDYFCPMDAKLTERETLISLSEIYAMLDQCAASGKVLLVDACRDDPQSELSKSSRKIELEAVHERLEIPVFEGGTIALKSCSRSQQSYEDHRLEHGIFFYHVIEGLRGSADFDQDRNITISELEAFATKRVKDYARSTLGVLQTPARFSQGEVQGDIVLAINPLPRPEILKIPFSAPQASAAQVKWAEFMGTQSSVIRAGMKMMLIPPGEFSMGSSDELIEQLTKEESSRQSFEREKNVHQARITQPFLVSATEVTRRQFEAFVAQTGYQTESERTNGGSVYLKSSAGIYEYKYDRKYSWRDPGYLQADDHPVVQVSWNDAIAFCNWLSRQDGLPEYYSVKDGVTICLDGPGYRLPTEAEWEFACRAGTTTRYSFGDDAKDMYHYGNVADVSFRNKYELSYGIEADDNHAQTAAVGSYLPNAFGLFDMHGNVAEYCWDFFGEHPGNTFWNYSGPKFGAMRVIRSGRFLVGERHARSSSRGLGYPQGRNDSTGFRVVANLSAMPQPLVTPCDSHAAETAQQSWANYLSTDINFVTNIGIELVVVPPGEFTMGTSDEELALLNEHHPESAGWLKLQAPAHRVKISQPFFVGKSEVTKKAFSAFVNDTGWVTTGERFGGWGLSRDDSGKFVMKQAAQFNWKNIGLSQTDDEPVVNVSWIDAVAFCNWLSRVEGLNEYYEIDDLHVTTLGGSGYRLPTESEWEFAGRAGTQHAYAFGDTADALQRYDNIKDTSFATTFGITQFAAEWDDGYAQMAPVQTFRPNAFGVHDMHGNVAEWCHDYYADFSERAMQIGSQLVIDPKGPVHGGNRVVRGGSWWAGKVSARLSTRQSHLQSMRSMLMGFRIARSPLAEP
ncbi:MAG TPA: SUMF1/EgtB/PvdO family nonheme iron enzyme [Pirellulaceae bacterium]|nr:SUMF1/EgtB/PvdO family nonheme iron enzyme [Pirellulaceae bacterium]HMO91167.1 SUMF1/EgtB/PvdO family nonheme iron enzyme [Pirellulaceae bacterium]HMP69063.1 SUMF1/EgtB/PvdO family nonheme iron enzyme [Pirellulaceae bacterium]